MKKIKLWTMTAFASLAILTTVPVLGEDVGTDTETAAEAEVSDNQLSAPTDFQFDPATGDYSFTATDERMGYYFVRVYAVENGKEVGDYAASSKRINGGSIGEFTGTVDLSKMGWGTYHVNLVSFAAAGTDYVKPDPLTIKVQYGVDLPLERPEMMAMASGNTVEFVMDWWTLSDYYRYEYLPNVEFKIYSDAECTQEVMEDTVDLAEFKDIVDEIPPLNAYMWDYSFSVGTHFYTITREVSEDQPIRGASEMTFAFTHSYPYTLEAGTYYATCQALSKDEYTKDSQVSSVVEFTLTDQEPTEDYSTAKTEFWVDPTMPTGDRPGAMAGQQADRVDNCTEQTISAKLLD